VPENYIHFCSLLTAWLYLW